MFLLLDPIKHSSYFEQTIILLYNEWKDIFAESGLTSIKRVRSFYKKNKHIRFYILVIDNKVIACYSFNDDFYLCDVVVDPAYRQKGYSRLLMKDVFNRANNEGWSKIYLNTNSKLIPFYKHFGFIVLKKVKKDEFRMVKILNERKSALNSYFVLFVLTGTVSVLTWIVMAS